MGCDGPELPDNSPQEIAEPPKNNIDDAELEDSDDERIQFGYELLPQDPEAGRNYDDERHDSEDERIFDAALFSVMNARYGPIDVAESESTEAANGSSEHSTAMNTESLDQTANAGIDVPPIEPMDSVLMREVWNAPRHEDSIEMTADRAEQIRRAMANFTLPFQSEPTWGQAVSNQMLEQWIRNRLNNTNNKIN